MNKRFFYIFLFWSVALVFTGCSDFQKILKSDNVDKKYEAALKYYDKKDYYKAGILLEELIPLLKGRPESEKAQFLFANTNYLQRDYVLSAYYFRNFTIRTRVANLPKKPFFCTPNRFTKIRLLSIWIRPILILRWKPFRNTLTVTQRAKM